MGGRCRDAVTSHHQQLALTDGLSECGLNPSDDPWQEHHQQQGGRDRGRDTVVTEPSLYFTQQSMKTQKTPELAAECWCK